MNIYEKLAEIRLQLTGLNIKKTGQNKFAGYDYYELGDIMPPITDLERKHNLVSLVSFMPDKATLTLIDCDKPEDAIVFESPMAEATLKGAHAIQNLGAVETYQRRYLYMAAYSIVEHDFFDATQGSAQGNTTTPPGKKAPSKPSQAKNKKPAGQPRLSDAAGAELRAALNEYTALTGAQEKNVLALLSQESGYAMKTLNDEQAKRLVAMLNEWSSAVKAEIAQNDDFEDLEDFG